MRGKLSFLPGEVLRQAAGMRNRNNRIHSGNSRSDVRLNRKKSAEAIVPRGKKIHWEGLNNNRLFEMKEGAQCDDSRKLRKRRLDL